MRNKKIHMYIRIALFIFYLKLLSKKHLQTDYLAKLHHFPVIIQNIVFKRFTYKKYY